MSRENWSNEKLFDRLLNNKTKKTYWENIRELRKRADQYIYTKASELAQAENIKAKIIGIDVLAQLGFNPRFNRKGVLSCYFQLLESTQAPKVLESILYGIGHNNENLSSKRILKLVEYKNHNFSDVRYALVHALLGLEDESAIETLIQLSKDKYPSVRDWATFAIGSQIEKNNDQIIQMLWDRIEDENQAVKQEAIAGLAKRKDARVKSILIHELEHIDDHGSILLESIEDFGDKSFIELLEKQILKNKQTRQVNEKWLLDCIDTLKNQLLIES